MAILILPIPIRTAMDIAEGTSNTMEHTVHPSIRTHGIRTNHSSDRSIPNIPNNHSILSIHSIIRTDNGGHTLSTLTIHSIPNLNTLSILIILSIPSIPSTLRVDAAECLGA